jgi:hypothetical protein
MTWLCNISDDLSLFIMNVGDAIKVRRLVKHQIDKGKQTSPK